MIKEKFQQEDLTKNPKKKVLPRIDDIQKWKIISQANIEDVKEFAIKSKSCGLAT